MRYNFQSAMVSSGGAKSNPSWAPFRTTARLAAVLSCCSLLLGPSAQPTRADVTEVGNVLLSDDNGATFYGENLIMPGEQGIPSAGNFLNENNSLTNQLNFEGRIDNKGTATTVDDENVNFDVYVGQTSYGLLTINGADELRAMNLIIGDSGTVPGSPILRRGSGYVKIENPGSVYNNDPAILPFPFYLTGVSPSMNPRSAEPGATDGFDLFVGRNGNGDLSISLGGRAEIQDAAIVGDQSDSVGTLLIDGIGSFLQSGGFETDDTAIQDVHYMIVGRLGSGTMTIANGGQSYNSGPSSTTGGGNNVVFGAVVGSNLAALDTAAPGNGGQGTVYVDGVTSKWTIGGNLQIGGFHDKRTGIGPTAIEDLDGNEVQYFAGAGRGTLHVSNGALVSIVTPPLDETASNVPDRLDLLVGHFGRIELDGGRMELLGAFDATNPQNPNQQLERGRLINDGVVAGNGSISVLQFRNRVLGEVRVGAGQKLRVDATGSFLAIPNIPVPGEEEYPLSNYGVIEVLGTETQRAEIEFRRGPGVPTAPIELTRPFLNLPVVGPPAAPNGRTEGLIHGQDSIMRFRSDLWNRGVLAFTQGSNVVSGDVVNFGDSAPGADDHGRIVIGPDTNVAFEDDLIFLGGTFQVDPTASFQVLAGNSFTFGGTLQIGVDGTPTGMEFNNPFQIAGDATFGGILEVTLTNGALIPPLSSVPIANVGGTIFGNFAVVNVFGSTLDFFTSVQGNNLVLQSFVAPPAGDGPDLNGDGIVNDLDYAIWKQNFGTPGPAGDANGDGSVDAADYTIWRDNCCGPFPGAGSGSGVGAGFGGTVPEPASVALLLGGGLLALAFGRRRSS